MKKTLPLSALLSGLLATPLLAAVPPRPQTAAVNDSTTTVVPAPYADSPAEVTAAQLPGLYHGQVQVLINGQPLNTYGMQDLNRRIAEDMEWRLKGLLMQQRASGLPTPIDVQLPTARPQRTERGAYLGVLATEMPAVLRDQLALPRGMGMVVEYVEKDSPADVAGIRVHDVLEKIEDQWVVNAQQLAVLVRAKHPGDTLNVTVLRGGKETALSAKLAEKDLPVLENTPQPGTAFAPTPFGGMAPLGEPRPGALDYQLKPRAASISVRVEPDGTERRSLLDDQHDITITKDKAGTEHVSIKDRAGRSVYDGGPNLGPNVSADVAAKVLELRQKSAKITFDHEPVVGENTKSVTLSRADNDHQITLRTDDRGRILTVKELSTGKMLYDGPYRGDEDLKDLPPAILEKVKALSTKMNLATPTPDKAPGHIEINPGL